MRPGQEKKESMNFFYEGVSPNKKIHASMLLHEWKKK